MAGAKRITDLMLDRQRTPADGRQILWDLAEAGLGVRIGAKRRTFILKLRHHGRQQMLTLGQYPSMTIADARVAARKIKGLSVRGVDPAEQTTAASAGRQAKLSMVSELVEAYIESYAKPNLEGYRRAPPK